MFLFALVILLRHAEYFLDSIEKTPFGGSALAVEFFFIVSGYLLAGSALQKDSCPPRTSLKKLCALYRKIMQILP